MGKRSSGTARASYAYRRYLSEVAYKAKHGPDNGAGAAEIVAQWKAGEQASSYHADSQPIRRRKNTADPA